MRIRQELLLGVGGVRALAALGISPGVVHLNEGHSAFAALELIRRRMTSEGIDVDEATRRVAAQVVFTTHTPVPAGHDRFSPALDRGAPRTAARRARAVATTTFLALGRVNPARPRRGVLHDRAGAEVVPARQRGVVAARPGLARDVDAALSGPARGPRADRPHHQRRARQTWLAPQMRQVYDRHLGADWTARSTRAGPLGRDRERRRRRAVGDASDAQGAPDRLHAPARRAAGRTARRAARGRRAAAPRAEPRRADDRLRAPVRHLQARQPAAAGPRGARRAGEPSADAGAARSSPARRIRSTARQDGAAGDRRG